MANHHHVQVFRCGIDQVCFPGLHQLRQLVHEPYDSSLYHLLIALMVGRTFLASSSRRLVDAFSSSFVNVLQRW